MAWPNDDLARRAGVAKELDRQSFWKAAYAAGLNNGLSNLRSEEQANRALLDFDVKFKGTPS